MNKKCKHTYNCGCEKYLTTPPACPPSEPCEDYQPCSSYTDAECVIYTGEDLICNGEIIIENGEILSKSLEKLVDKLCESSSSSDQDFSVDITPAAGYEIGNCINILESTVTGGSGTFTYLWEVVSNQKYKVVVDSDPTLSTAILVRNVDALSNNILQLTTLVRLRVTDTVTGKVKDAYYSVYTECDNPVPTPP